MLKLPHQINIRISKEEKDMVSALQEEPLNINMSDFIRASIRNIYKVRIINKKEAVKADEPNAANNAK